MKIKGKEINITVLFISIILIALFIWIIIPVSIHSIGVKEPWLGFLSNYIGSIIGALTTIIAFAFTYSLNKKQNAYVLKQDKEQNEALRKADDEKMRLQSLPFINVEKMDTDCSESYIEGFYFDTNDVLYEKKDHSNVSWYSNYFYFVNIGVAPAIDVRISKSRVSIGHISLHSKKGVYLHFPNTVDYFNLSVVYQDRECRKYQQEINIVLREYITQLGNDMPTLCVENVTPPVLISDNN